MVPIHELLNRISWDTEFGRGEFVIGYFDRVADSVIRVPLRQVFFDPADHLPARPMRRESRIRCRFTASVRSTRTGH